VVDHTVFGRDVQIIREPLQLVADIDDVGALDGWGRDPLAIAVENFQCSDLTRCEECQDWPPRPQSA